MPVYSRKLLSGSGSGGLPLQATATSAATALTIHQVQATATGSLECLWLNIRNTLTNDGVVKLIIDTSTATGREMAVMLQDRTSTGNMQEIFKGLPLTGTDTTIRGYLATGQAGFLAEGYYNLIATG